ncbi:hypothetical protein [Streptomyces celluloflavus]|uniref:hypothetical protein n=1 Tax=Streptomyces celluloflavus TaxID=58344 RepID=UPI0036A88A87
MPAPLLCAGIIGYRALRRSALPANGRLGIYGFGASAHLAAQVALAIAARIGIRVTASPYPLSRAPQALTVLAADRINGAAVLVPNDPPRRTPWTCPERSRQYSRHRDWRPRGPFSMSCITGR